MGRSRKMPPLFEVMRETDRRVAEARAEQNPGVILPRATEPAPEKSQAAREAAAKLRLSHQGGHQGGHHGSTNGVSRADEGAAEPAPGRGVVLPLPMLLAGAGVLIAIVAVIAMIAFNAGANRERKTLLPSDTGGPPPVSKSAEPADSGAEKPRGTPPAPKDDGVRPPPGNAALPVFGDDPRVEGTNYLIVETMMFDDAMAAAEFLTANGVPSVVVVPENSTLTPSELQKNPRGMWQIIVREGFTRDEFRTNSARAGTIEKNVQQLGRRWKDDHKGTTNFSRCFWKKFGK